MLNRLLPGLVFVAACTSAASAQSVTASIDDVRVIEGDAGTTDAIFTVTLSSAADATLDWSTDVFPAPPGSATAGVDYVSDSGSLTFTSIGSVSQQVVVTVLGDNAVEEYETFSVDLSNAAGATVTKRRGVGTILDEDDDNRPMAELPAVLTGWDGVGNTPRSRLQFRVPAAADKGSPADFFRLSWNTGAGCSFPPAPDATSDGRADCYPNPFPGPGETASCDHADLVAVEPAVLADLAADETYCYTIWVHFTSGRFSQAEAHVKVKTLEQAPGARVWSYVTGDGLTNVVPPSLASAAIYTVAGNGDVHALSRGAAGGTWPAAWNPVSVGDGAHWRSPLVPLSGLSLFFVVTDNTSSNEQRMHAVNAENGSLAWSTAAVTPTPEAGPGPATGTFTYWGAAQDMVVMGTTAGTNDNRVYAFDPFTGEAIGVFPDADDTDPGIGKISAFTADYSTNRLYFTTHKGGTDDTVWCLDILPGAGSVDLDLGWAIQLSGDANIDQAPVLRSGHLMIGDDGGRVYWVAASDGEEKYSRATSDGAPKRFLFPDWTGSTFFLSTNGKVHGWSNDGSAFAEEWVIDTIPTPSLPLWWRGEDLAFVGGGDGRLYQIDTTDGSVTGSVFLGPESDTQIGAPSFDRANDLVLVGGTDGVIHAVDRTGL